MPVLVNPRWERYAQARAAGETISKAYATAGFAVHKTNGYRLEENKKVQARVQEILGRAAERVEIDRARVLAELGKIGFANMADYITIGEDGDAYIDLSALDRDEAAAIAEITVEDFKEGRGEDARDVRRIKFKLADKRAALVDIGKILGMFTTKVQHSGHVEHRHMDADAARDTIKRFLDQGKQAAAEGAETKH